MELQFIFRQANNSGTFNVVFEFNDKDEPDIFSGKEEVLINFGSFW